MVTVKVPGKLFLMGEYSVINGSTPALILPTQRMLFVTVKKSDQWAFKSDLERSWTAKSWADFYHNAFQDLQNILTVLKDVLDLTKPLSWTVESQLDDKEHAYGLGSSGAFTVAMIKATTQFYHHDLTPFELFKWSVKSQITTASSYGDLAVSSFQTPLYYRRPFIINETFDGFIITPFTMPLAYDVIHSKVKVKSGPYIDAFFDKIKSQAVKAYIDATNKHIEAFIKTPSTSIIEEASHAYLAMARHIHPGIVSPVLEDILSWIQENGGVGKISGAGGGDNVLAFYPKKKPSNIPPYPYL